MARLLVVEDDPGIAGLMGMYLRRAGHLVEPFGDGDAALRWFAAHGATVDLVILDLMLPGLDGRGVCRRIWSGEAGPWSRTVDVHVSRLRDRLDAAAAGLDIEGVRGVGYRLVVSDDR